jgi:hypothetical protein
MARNYIQDRYKKAEGDAYSYAYNDGHSDSRKREEYRPNLSGAKQESDFKKILKQKAAESQGKWAGYCPFCQKWRSNEMSKKDGKFTICAKRVPSPHTNAGEWDWFNRENFARKGGKWTKPADNICGVILESKPTYLDSKKAEVLNMEAPMVEEPDFMPNGDGRAIGQQNSAINLTPLHAESNGNWVMCDFCSEPKPLGQMKRMPYDPEQNKRVRYSGYHSTYAICNGCYRDRMKGKPVGKSVLHAESFNAEGVHHDGGRSDGGTFLSNCCDGDITTMDGKKWKCMKCNSPVEVDVDELDDWYYGNKEMTSFNAEYTVEITGFSDGEPKRTTGTEQELKDQLFDFHDPYDRLMDYGINHIEDEGKAMQRLTEIWNKQTLETICDEDDMLTLIEIGDYDGKNAESFNADGSGKCPICNGDVFSDMESVMLGQNISSCDNCKVFIHDCKDICLCSEDMKGLPPHNVFCIDGDCGFGQPYGSGMPCESCEPVAEQIETLNVGKGMNAESKNDDLTKVKEYTNRIMEQDPTVMAEFGRFGLFKLLEHPTAGDLSPLLFYTPLMGGLLMRTPLSHVNEMNDELAEKLSKTMVKQIKQGTYFEDDDWADFLYNAESFNAETKCEGQEQNDRGFCDLSFDYGSSGITSECKKCGDELEWSWDDNEYDNEEIERASSPGNRCVLGDDGYCRIEWDWGTGRAYGTCTHCNSEYEFSFPDTPIGIDDEYDAESFNDKNEELIMCNNCKTEKPMRGFGKAVIKYELSPDEMCMDCQMDKKGYADEMMHDYRDDLDDRWYRYNQAESFNAEHNHWHNKQNGQFYGKWSKHKKNGQFSTHNAETLAQIEGPTAEATAGGLHSPSSFDITWEDLQGLSSPSMPPNEIHFSESKKSSSIKALGIASIVGLSVWKGIEYLTAKKSLKQSAEDKRKGKACGSCKSQGTMRKGQTQIKNSEYSVGQVNPVEAEGQEDVMGAEGVKNPRHAPSPTPSGYPSKSLKMW